MTIFEALWKFHDFAITQILREINFGNCRSVNSAISTHLEAMNFCTFQTPNMAKMVVLELQDSPKVISRKI